MSFEGVVRRPVYLQVAEQLREAILEGELPAGSPLPAERELTERFGVSRTSVREALRSLQAQGLVEANGPTAPLRVAAAETLSAGPVRESLTQLLRLGRVPLADLVELRCALEAAAVEGAARRRPRPDLSEAREQIEAMHAVGDDLEAYDRADVQFHLALARASGNEALLLVMLAVRPAMAAYLLEALRRERDPQATLARLTREHEAIVKTIEDREPDLAGELMRDHVLGLYQDLLR